MARSAVVEPPQTPQPTRRTSDSGDTSMTGRTGRRSNTGNRRVSLATVASSAINRAETPKQSAETPVRASSNSGTGRESIGNHPPSQNDIEQWMKLLRTNRINAENSWNFPIIDYFHDIVKDGDGINFQTASYTLDGCVKVYSTRVDSLVAKTSRLLSGLVGSDLDGVNPGSEDAEDTNDDGTKPKATKKRVRKAITCVSPDSLCLDLKPLLQVAGSQRAPQDFDEGGTSGTRLWKESTDTCGWVGGNSSKIVKQVGPIRKVSPVDVAYYRTAFLSDIDQRSVHVSAKTIDQMVSDPSGTADLIQGVQGWSLEDQQDPALDAASNLGDNDLDYDQFDDDISAVATDFGDFEDEDIAAAATAAAAASGSGGGAVNWDLMAYFDERSSTGWAGPSHWRVQHYHKFKGTLPGAPASANSTLVLKKTSASKKKQILIIDFSAAPLDEDELMAKGKTTLDLPKKQQSISKFLLPEDHHITSKEMLRLFLRPDDGPAQAFSRAAPGNLHNVQSDIVEDADMEMNDEFWGQVSTQEPLRYDAGFYENTELPEDMAENMPIPNSGVFDEVNALSQSRRSDQITYARVARNVDVQQLKKNMWTTLKDTTETCPEEHLTLSSIMTHTAEKYSPEKQKELSTPFYFICLLHLANEQGLTLNNTPDLGDLEINPGPEHTS
ncbi:Condensin complex subunit 2 [Wickerhamiella sorbophila]|uniref:Condensin complex subunit 2 n=1 Tax=Wickerhamiella sorbophila TaxID=45607 RepID=A0A2T0FFA5_9ASCO|nr:Condensin complex subunit 2 [Wickerhamiella sorbophila]PRT53683.1 Condensin complex subunit 2 [Wickerhamiella sorbophila]